MSSITRRSEITNEQMFALRWDRGRRDLVGPMNRLYADDPNMHLFPDRLKSLLLKHWAARPANLRLLDLKRDPNPNPN